MSLRTRSAPERRESSVAPRLADVERPDHELRDRRDGLDAERRRAVRRALDALAPSDRFLVQAAVLEGESGNYSAKSLGIRPDAVYQRLLRSGCSDAACSIVFS